MILLDTNVILDVIQERTPHYAASAVVVDKVVRKQLTAALPAHAVTTVHFIIGRYQGTAVANKVIGQLLDWFEIAAVGQAELVRAHGFGWFDFEDSVVVAAAESARCKIIVTRNVQDFRNSPVAALTPEEFLADQT